MPSSAAGSDLTPDAAGFDVHALLHDPLVEATRALVERGVVGAAWIDPALTVVSVAGAVPDSIRRGVPVMDALVALIGLEDAFAALRTEPGTPPIRIPNTAIVSRAGTPSARMNLTLFWFANRQHYLLVMGAILSEASVTTELDQEVRRRRLIEQDLAARSLEYERINQQLEQFAYVISHDLNAPLRALRYLSADIQTALADDSRASPDLAFVGQAAAAIAMQTRRMSKMMVDLLDYARIGRIKKTLAMLDTHALISEIVTSLRPTSTVTITVDDPWPVFETAAAPLDLVLRNLVENAIKHHDRADGHVTITAEQLARDVLFRVSDDGRGIPPEWHAAIFEPFRKIDDAHHPDSSGIGLALVKRTVMLLGGSIEVRSAAPDQRGTTFLVRWPLKLADVETATSE